MNPWTAFWLCVAVFVVCDCVVFLNGLDSAFWAYKTPIEQEIQKAKTTRCSE